MVTEAVKKSRSEAIVQCMAILAATPGLKATVVEADTLKFVFKGDIETQIDVVAVVEAGAAVDAEFADNVVDVLDEAGVEYEDWC
jgi:hypothetical protein